MNDPWHALADAAKEAAAELRAVGPGIGEIRDLKPTIRGCLERQAGWTVSRHEKTLDVPRWCHPPGGVDVDVRDPDDRRYIGELKLRKTDEVLWDLLKLADAVSQPHVAAAFLLVGSTAPDIERKDMCFDLFSPEPQQHETLALFRRNRRAWSNLLQGGTARPLRMPAIIRTSVQAAPSINLDGKRAQLFLVDVAPDWAHEVALNRDCWCGDWPPGVEPHPHYLEWRERHYRFLSDLDVRGPVPHDEAQALSKGHRLNLERDTALTHACAPLVSAGPERRVTDHGHGFLDWWGSAARTLSGTDRQRK